MNNGKQSNIGVSFRDYGCYALPVIAKVEKEGADEYGRENWKKISVADAVEHAILHYFNYLATGDEKELNHAATRGVMAVGKNEYNKRCDEKMSEMRDDMDCMNDHDR